MLCSKESTRKVCLFHSEKFFLNHIKYMFSVTLRASENMSTFLTPLHHLRYRVIPQGYQAAGGTFTDQYYQVMRDFHMTSPVVLMMPYHGPKQSKKFSLWTHGIIQLLSEGAGVCWVLAQPSLGSRIISWSTHPGTWLVTS